jgi:hypothetical protein
MHYPNYRRKAHIGYLSSAQPPLIKSDVEKTIATWNCKYAMTPLLRVI